MELIHGMEAQEYYAKLDEAKRLAPVLHRILFTSEIEFEVVKNGRIINRHKQRGHSMTRNWYVLLLCQCASANCDASVFGSGYLSMKQTNGTVDAVAIGSTFSTNDGALQGSVGDANKGVVVGTGSTAFTFVDYCLETPVADGSGAGQLQYGAAPTPQVSWDGSARQFEVVHRRWLNNESGAGIVVAELGIVQMYGHGGSTPLFRALVARDVLGATVSVADGALLRAKYTILSGVLPS